VDLVDLKALESVLRDLDEPPAPPLRVFRLDGGYSWRTFRIVGRDDRAVILRLAPAGGTMEPYDPEVEARAIATAFGSVPLPQVLLVERSSDPLGAPFSVQSELTGSTVRPSDPVPARDQGRYRDAFARALGRIHAVPVERPITVTDALREELTVGYGHYRRAAPWVHPGFEIGYRWLRARIPLSDDPAVLCHGDFRLANLLWTAPGDLTGVLDWERAWLGDPMSDVAFTRLFSGWCSVSGDAVPAYEKESALRVDDARLEYGMRFERWRSFTSSMRGMSAFLDGRNRDPRLLGIGLSGDGHAWEMVGWLEPDLPPLADDEMVPMRPPELPHRWLSEHMPEFLDQLRMNDAIARSSSLDALEAAAGDVPELADVLVGGDAESTWSDAFVLLAGAARSGGSELVPALEALAVRTRHRPRLRVDQLPE
jgi:aminoglycoside phosphotransferase (APT) family kinase protein